MTPSSPAVSIPVVEQAPPAVWAAAGEAKRRRKEERSKGRESRRARSSILVVVEGGARPEVCGWGVRNKFLMVRHDVERTGGRSGGRGAFEGAGGERSEIMRQSVS